MPAKTRPHHSLPTGAVTFLFTDIEGSTSLWEAHPDAMRVALARHDALMRDAIVGSNGHVFKTVGDAFCAAFGSASDAVRAAFRAQTELASLPWPEETCIKVRMALHTGAVEARDRDYFGPPVNRVARLLSTAYGGQTLLSQATSELSQGALPDGATLRDLGVHRLKDLASPERIYELHHPGLATGFPPIRSLSTHPNNLPQQLTSFIGRGREITEIGNLLARHRLLTLTGSGGCGKTRLALHVAAESLVQFPDGAWFVELAPIVDPALVPRTVAEALALTEVPDTSISETIVRHVQDKQLLLVLDNCEHVLGACAFLVDSVLRQCPRVRVLATTREALGITGEQNYRVPSLSLPDRKRDSPLAALSAHESVQLFVDRALLARSDFAVTERNARALASVCCNLDGIPLAIELAAARMRTLSLEEINDKLDDRFALLTSGSRTALPRHQTLRALIDWSYELLSSSEQSLLASLSIFAGGCTLAAAERVGVGEATSRAKVLDAMASLSNKSLVVSEESDGRSRYRLLETVREYAREKLCAEGDDKRLGKRHCDYFVELAETARRNLIGAEQAVWLQRLEEEHDNFRGALEWCLTEGAVSTGLRLCGSLQRFWVTHGHFSEGREWCERFLARSDATDTSERANALHAAGALAYYQSDYGSARQYFEKSLSIRERLGDQAGISASFNVLGNVAIEQGDYVLARARHEASLAIARELEDRWSIANALLNLGIVAVKQGDHAAARPLYEECLVIRRESGDRMGIAVALTNLGDVVVAQGHLATARTFYEESLAIRRELGDRRGISLSLGNLAHLALEEGNLGVARSLGAESLSIGREIGAGRLIVQALEGAAAINAAAGNPLRAACLWGTTERMREANGSAPSQIGRKAYAELVANARAALSDDAHFDQAWGEGRALSLEEAIALALRSD